MIFWVVVVLVALAVVAALLIPMLKQHAAPTEAAAFDMEVYRDQLRQIDRDRAAGLVSEAEAAAGRTEVGRRLLAADSRRKETRAKTRVRAGTGAALAVGILVPVCAVLLYSDLGVPGLPGFPYSERGGQGRDRMPELRILAKQLEKRLEKDPTKVQGWILLGRTYVELTEYDKAAKVYDKALTYDGGNAELRSAYGEALVLKAQGVVTPDARNVFETVLKAAPKNPRALFYLAVADEQSGKLQDALDRWRALLESSPPDAPWAPVARERATKTAAALGLDPAKALPQAPAPVAKGPTAQDMAAAQSMSPEDRRAMIESMVQRLADRLKAKPNDLDGWLRLGRAYTVLEKHADARDALAKAAALAPNNTDVLLLQGRAIRAASGDKETPESLAVMRKVLAIDANNVEALWLVGLAEVAAGDRAAGMSKMQQAVDHLPIDAPNRAALAHRLEALKNEKK
jgi:cytochrome c-type biogenesis protein CcmH